MTEGKKPTHPPHRPRQGGDRPVRIKNPEVVEKMKEVIQKLADEIREEANNSRNGSLLKRNVGSLNSYAQRYADNRLRGSDRGGISKKVLVCAKTIRVGVTKYGFTLKAGHKAEAINLVAKSGEDTFERFCRDDVETLAEYFTELGRQRFEQLEAERRSSQGRGG